MRQAVAVIAAGLVLGVIGMVVPALDLLLLVAGSLLFAALMVVGLSGSPQVKQEPVRLTHDR